jgi:hypothetical protein
MYGHYVYARPIHNLFVGRVVYPSPVTLRALDFSFLVTGHSDLCMRLHSDL